MQILPIISPSSRNIEAPKYCVSGMVAIDRVKVTNSNKRGSFPGRPGVGAFFAAGTVSLDLKIDLPRPRAEEMCYSDHLGKLARKIIGAIEG